MLAAPPGTLIPAARFAKLFTPPPPVDTGLTPTVAEADLVLSAALVAVTV
jgi:hypothetical protein